MNEEWKKIYSKNGKLMYEGFTKDGRPFGSGTSYFANGNKCQEGVFDTKGFVYGKEYYQNGNLRFEGAYKHHKGYGPNYPVFGCCYDEDGNEFFYGEFKIIRSGLGWPKIETPEYYDSVVPKGLPDFEKYMWPAEEKTLEGVYYARPRGKNARTKFVVFLEKNGFKCEDNEITSRDSTIASKFPIKVDLDKRLYSHLHNATSAAAAANSRMMWPVSKYSMLFECVYSYVVV